MQKKKNKTSRFLKKKPINNNILNSVILLFRICGICCLLGALTHFNLGHDDEGAVAQPFFFSCLNQFWREDCSQYDWKKKSQSRDAALNKFVIRLSRFKKQYIYVTLWRMIQN